ncbi:hypothetical protein GCM10017322_33830 [Paracoccus aerius]|nr:hypothetical protein GCM10017322_33830 [Paracoccus aerius]
MPGHMHLEYILFQIEPDRENFRHDRSPLWTDADPPGISDAVRGGRIINANPTPLAPHPLVGEAPAAPNSEGKA